MTTMSASEQSKKTWWTWGTGLALVLAAAGLAAACGGSAVPADENAVAGLVSTGSQQGGTISLRDRSDPVQTRSATIAADGTFALDTAGLKSPFTLRATWSDRGAESTVAGVATTGASWNGTVTLRDSSSPPLARTAEIDDDDGSFSVDASGMKPPYEVEAEFRSRRNVGRPASGNPTTGAELYVASCAACHGPLATSEVKRASTRDISEAIQENEGGMGALSSLTSKQIADISAALSAPTTTVPTPTTCTSFTYSPWSACENGSQSRTVLTTSPTGCTGGSPVVLTQACTPAPATCTSFTYSPWGDCQSSNTQTRTVTGSSPAGCTGGSPVLSQACTYVPPVTSCTSFTYSPWGDCQSSNTQTRTVTGSSPAGCTGGSPVLSQACTYVPPTCTYTYSAWSACSPTGTQTRTVASSSPAGCAGTPVLTQSCTYTPPTCTSFTYNAWGACQPNNTQTRTVATSSPTGCTGGTPILSQACTYTAPCTLATAVPSCSACHSLPPSSHNQSIRTCATCHGPVNNGTGTPSTGMTATAGSGGACVLGYPVGGTHNNGTVNRGAAQ